METRRYLGELDLDGRRRRRRGSARVEAEAEGGAAGVGEGKERGGEGGAAGGRVLGSLRVFLHWNSWGPAAAELGAKKSRWRSRLLDGWNVDAREVRGGAGRPRRGRMAAGEKTAGSSGRAKIETQGMP